MGRIIAVANQKGGVGKTTTSVNLSASLAAAKHTVLLIDLDPQGNATMGCGVDKGAVEGTSCDLLLGERSMKEVTLSPPGLGFDVVPANGDLTAAEVRLMAEERRERRLAGAARCAAAPLAQRRLAGRRDGRRLGARARRSQALR